MQKALRMAGLRPEDIDYVNAHGTGTPNNDASESAALRRIFGEIIPPVSSTKAFTGHTTSASGTIEAVFCLLALQQGFIPANLNWQEPDPSCIVPSAGGAASLQHILCNAFGFGGNDSSLLFSR
jgi:3-oxoacyl-[acyl-carrier-protein] synthase-1